MTATTDVLSRHVTLFNDGVRTGDFTPMVAWFTDDAELVFENIPVGPFHGRAAIAAAYASQPPDDEIALIRARTAGNLIVASYAWASAPDTHAGDMVITTNGDRISRLVVVYGRRYHRDIASGKWDSEHETICENVSSWRALWTLDTVTQKKRWRHFFRSTWSSSQSRPMLI